MFAGRYRIERVIGSGGMGVVLKATHIHLGQPVAIKLLQPRLVRSASAIERFLREAQLVARLKSEHVVRVIDLGMLNDGTPFIVLEHLDGMDLSQLARLAPSLGEVVDLVLQACEGLAEVHALGVVHRDIKPANLFVTQRADRTRLLKILDFGISKTVLSTSLTVAGTTLGTPAYMSPEQFRSPSRVDVRSDIWSLGAVLYRLLRGAPPFIGDTSREVALRVQHDPLPRFTLPLPGALDAIVERCLEKDPERRFHNVAELAHALSSYAESASESTLESAAGAAISAERTRRTLGNITLELTAPPDPESEPAPQHPTTLDLPAAADSQEVRWPLVLVMTVLACVLGALVAVVAK